MTAQAGTADIARDAPTHGSAEHTAARRRATAHPELPRLVSDSCSSPHRSRYLTSFSASLTIHAWCFARVVAINSPKDLHLLANAYAGHTETGRATWIARPALGELEKRAPGLEPATSSLGSVAKLMGSVRDSLIVNGARPAWFQRNGLALSCH